MSTIKSSATKKTMIITGVNQEIYPLFEVITNKKNKDMMILNSFGAVITQPYGCLIRNIILAVYNEMVDEIYIIGEMESKEVKLNMSDKIKEHGVSGEILKTINYIDVVERDVISWLTGPQSIEDVIKKNKDLIKGHPLIPKTIPVHAYIANPKTGEYYPV
ncbi:hypothetical protein G3A_14950 [Bacillus sp. 17376]|nr:hypothetical protein G3A_14950 [Bacillus sp. 17376]